MKTLNLKLDLEGILLADEDKKRTGSDIAVSVIKNIILGYANRPLAGGNNRVPTGLTEDERYKYYKICNTLNKALKNKEESIKLDDDWLEFIKKCKRETNFIPNELFRRVENLIDDIKGG